MTQSWRQLRRLSLKDVPISVKVFLAPGLILGALLLLAAVSFIGLRDARLHVRDLNERAFETFRLASEANVAATSVHAALLSTIARAANEPNQTRTAPEVADLVWATKQADAAIDALVRHLGPDLPMVAWLQTELDAYLRVAREVSGIVRDDPASASLIINEAEPDFRDLKTGLEHFQDQATEFGRTAARRATEDATVANAVFFAVLVLTVGFSLLITSLVARSIARPVADLTRVMQELAAGNLAAQVPDRERGDEVGSMAAALHVFQEGLIVAARLNAERESARSRELRRLRQFADATFEGIVIHRQGTVLDANTAFCALLGWPDAAALKGCSVLEFVTPESLDVARAGLHHPPGTVIEVEMKHTGGTTLPVEILSRPFEYDGEEVTLGAVRDLTEHKQAEAKIRRLAFHDGLTGLPNRHLLDDRLAQALELAGRTGTRLAVLCLDLDRFKFVNDLLGHKGGDHLLVEVAARLGATVRAMDSVARVGGDEFIIVQPLADHPQAPATLARRLIETLSAPYQIDGQQVEVGLSIGIALYPEDGRTAAALLKNGDTALYRAKLGGRGQSRFFEAEMDQQLRERRGLEQDLRQAFQRREFELNYQPLYQCGSRDLEGFEALLRWTHPTRGAIGPADFIPLAEECGLIVPLGLWVLETACREAASWPKPWSVAVNLSPTQLRGADFPDVVATVLANTGLPAERLELEVTENVLIANPDEALDVLTRLRAQGIRISLDDFGTGYSSLSYLRRFPFNKLKIDKSFIQDCEQNPEAAAIVGAIVTLGHSLNLCVTGEGVETEGQLSLLRGYHCHQAQGYLLGRPQRVDQLPGLMHALEVGDAAPVLRAATVEAVTA